MKKLYGVTTAMVTPFDEKGGVMVESVEKMVEFLVRRGPGGRDPLPRRRADRRRHGGGGRNDPDYLHLVLPVRTAG